MDYRFFICHTDAVHLLLSIFTHSPITHHSLTFLMPRSRRTHAPLVADSRQYKRVTMKPIQRARLASEDPFVVLSHFDDIRREADEENARECNYHSFCLIPRGRSGGDLAIKGEEEWDLDELFMFATSNVRLRRRYVRLHSGKHGLFVSITYINRPNLPEPQEEPNSPAIFDEEDLSD